MKLRGAGVGVRVEDEGYTPSTKQASKRGEDGPALSGTQADRDRFRVQGLVLWFRVWLQVAGLGSRVQGLVEG